MSYHDCEYRLNGECDCPSCDGCPWYEMIGQEKDENSYQPLNFQTK